MAGESSRSQKCGAEYRGTDDLDGHTAEFHDENGRWSPGSFFLEYREERRAHRRREVPAALGLNPGRLRTKRCGTGALTATSGSALLSPYALVLTTRRGSKRRARGGPRWPLRRVSSSWAPS
ncbi:hypothetical protein SAMN00790413_01081 [Deinococcus hopiensis KR-140]|uniref:Uncharacterized protein n=1 Tax=Deinococcus hopiensis KR-140 TaxID=695939 RepID=A0A1W1VDK3_9DEIO|nr:hypothetical protein SAMN00790413_01081 [Deinococcus hopiensis KR-140]